jgi:hypothetical protein
MSRAIIGREARGKKVYILWKAEGINEVTNANPSQFSRQVALSEWHAYSTYNGRLNIERHGELIFYGITKVSGGLTSNL